MTYVPWLTSLLPASLSGPWSLRWCTAIGETADDLAARAKLAVKVRFPELAPVDALPYLGADRALPQMPGEPAEVYRARITAAWSTWYWAGTSRSIREALVLYGLHGVSVVPHRVWRIDGDAARWARFRVYVTGYAASGEHLSGALTSGAWIGTGLGVEPLRSGEFRSGEFVSGTRTRPELTDALRGLVRLWSPARDRCAAIVFTWGGAISGAFLSGTTPSGGPCDVVSWRGSPHFV